MERWNLAGKVKSDFHVLLTAANAIQPNQITDMSQWSWNACIHQAKSKCSQCRHFTRWLETCITIAPAIVESLHSECSQQFALNNTRTAFFLPNWIQKKTKQKKPYITISPCPRDVCKKTSTMRRKHYSHLRVMLFCRAILRSRER